MTDWSLITIRGQHRCTYCSQQLYLNERGYRQKLGSWPRIAYLYLHTACMIKWNQNVANDAQQVRDRTA